MKVLIIFLHSKGHLVFSLKDYSVNSPFKLVHLQRQCVYELPGDLAFKADSGSVCLG